MNKRFDIGRLTTERGQAPRPAYPETAGSPAGPENDLGRKSEELAIQYARAQWDLGGLAYEMAIRDHFRLDVMRFHAGRMQQIDASLGEVERLLRVESGAAGGECGRCGALHGKGSFYCWQCGAAIVASPTDLETTEAAASSNGLTN